MYTVAENTQILISLLKQFGVRKVIASPGTMNVNFVGSIQNDSFFEIYSSVDERSAAYMACGMAAESGECVVLTCTGATASRNYIPGLTEAYYRKLPIIVVTATQPLVHIGHNMEQVIDRGVQLNDMVKISVQVPVVDNADDRWGCVIAINKALIETRRHGGGPVHINLEVKTLVDFSVKELPVVRKIDYFCGFNKRDEFPTIPEGNVVVFIGNHNIISEKLQDKITKFCEKYDAVVLCDQTSNYFGKYRVVPSVVIKQDSYDSACAKINHIIHIGNVSGSQFKFKPRSVWRINPDGEIRDTFKKLTCVFEMEEEEFFDYYIQGNYEPKDSYLKKWHAEQELLYSRLDELPFSNIWIAQQTINKLPINSIVHMGILNTLRSWNYFDDTNTFFGFSNTGGFGIDGGVSSLIGASLINKEKLYFGFFGDLGFFYDMNSLGNRHVGKNLRILMINNGKGTEFRKYNHPANKFGDDADKYMAASGHFGAKSLTLVKHYVEDLGFTYLCASDKDEYDRNIEEFVNPKLTGKSIFFEIFTNSEDESNAIKIINTIETNLIGNTMHIAKAMLGDKGINFAKKIVGR